jgi:hypothetical protein
MKYFRAALLGGLLLGLCGLNQGAAPPAQRPKPAPKGPFPTGNWKIRIPNLRAAGTRALWLVGVEKKDGKWVGRLVARAPGMGPTTLENLRLAGGELRFTLKADLKLPVRVKVRREGPRLYGSIELRNEVMLVEMEKTALTSLDPLDLEREKLAKTPDGFEAVQVALHLLQASEARKVKPAEVRKWGERAVKSASLYGPRYQRQVLLLVAEVLSEEKGYENIAVQYARRAERSLDASKESPQEKKAVLTVLASVLRKAGKGAEAKEALARIKKLDFRIKPKAFRGRKGKSNRVVLAELFTGSHSQFCVAADRAFNALGKTFKPTEVIRLCYHLGLPLPDPLASPASKDREDFYGEGASAVPTLLLNGKPAAPGGGDSGRAQEKYEQYVDAIAPLLEEPAKAQLKVSAVRKGKKIHITAEVDKLAEAGPEVRLRLVLVEEKVNYKGKNGETVHECVVRFMPGGRAGVALKTRKPLKKVYTIAVEDVREKLTAYLDKLAVKRPFPDKKRPLLLRKLRVVAFVQNNEENEQGIKEVFQAAQAEVKEEEKKEDEKE